MMKRLMSGALGVALAAQVAADVKVYSHPMDPRQHPDDARRLVKPPDAKTFGSKMQFMAMRSMNTRHYKTDLDMYTREFGLGDVIWAHSGMIFNTNVTEQVQELKRRNLYLFDLWGFVPGSGPGEWTQFKRPAGVTEMFERELGDHWLGMDNGEQDGRYVGVFAREAAPYGMDRFHQYLHFQRHFERMDHLLGNKMATLVSLNFGHYFLRECCYTLIGAETAQALPNSQIYYAFIRGAGKQYGVPWYGNVSVFNRWGWKAYPQQEAATTPESRNRGTPTGGTSLALMKKLMWAQIFYNSRVFGFESACLWSGKYTADGKTALSPIGRIQKDAVDWCAKHGDPGVMHTPVAVMVDFYSGWSFPRHLYTGRIYNVWGDLPYEPGDYLTDGVLDMLYPGYQDASYFRDERGFNTATPYGDIADCLLSDAPLWLLRQYPLLVLAGRLTPSDELRDTLTAYVRQGGELMLTAGNAKALFPQGFPAGGAGRATLIPGGDWGVADTIQCARPLVNKPETPLAKPFPLRPEARAALDAAFRRQRIFATNADARDDGLSVVTCRRGPGDYTLCVLNNTWSEKPFALTSCAGPIVACEDISPACAERTAIGFTPNTISNLVTGADSATTIAAGATRLFRVKTREAGAVAEIPFAAPKPNAGARTLVLRGAASIKEQILARPTFFRHHDAAMVDARYFLSRDRNELREQTDWIRKQGLRVAVDLAPVLNLFPDLRLVENDTNETARTQSKLADLLDKMEILGARDLFIALHHCPENNMARDKARENMAQVIRRLCRDAAQKGITVYLRQSPMRQIKALSDLPDWIHHKVKAPNLKPAPSLAAMMLLEGRDPAKIAKAIRAFGTDVWLVAAPAEDITGNLTSLHEPLADRGDLTALKPILDAVRAKGVRLVYDGIYPDADAEYRETRLFE